MGKEPRGTASGKGNERRYGLPFHDEIQALPVQARDAPHVVRDQEQVHAVLRVDLGLEPPLLEAAEGRAIHVGPKLQELDNRLDWNILELNN